MICRAEIVKVTFYMTIQVRKPSPREGARFQGSKADGIVNRNTLFYRKIWIRLEALKTELAV